MTRRVQAAAALLLLAAAAAAGGASAAPMPPLQRQGVEPSLTSVAKSANPASPNGIYIVQLKSMPAAVQAAQRGGQSGGLVTAAAAAAGAVQAQAQAVAARALGASASAKTTATYRYAFAGFAASLTPGDLQRLKTDPAVAAVWPDAIYEGQTIETPDFLGLTAPGGAWSQLGGNAGAGEGVIIGVIDSGIWPEHPSFADGGSYGPPPPRWRGACIDGQNFTAATHCNGKLIGCRHFNKGFGGDANVTAKFPNDFASCRDANSHGTHTASTAGGNHGVPISGLGGVTGQVSGMAPRARISVYKALWNNQGTTSDLLAAIDAAVRDGCDIISFSIGTSTPEPVILTPIEQAFFGAAAAGVFVSASAGNSGPSLGTVDHPAPWEITVAASTHDRQSSASLELGSGERFTGTGVHPQAVGPAPLVLAENVAAAGADAARAQLCFNGTLDPAKAAGKIVVCDRGVNARVEKSLAVQSVGSVGMVLVNKDAGAGLASDFHFVPTVHLESSARDAVRAYAAGAGATATLPPGLLITGALAPQMAGFSSRGPSPGYGWVIKPEISAPGVDILAAVSPVGSNGRLFDVMSGTSMSAPHVSGLAALVKQKHPTWSPMAIKSALMTTAYQTTRTGTPGQSFGGPFDYGAGHVDPTASLNPGLVLDSYLDDWIRFLCSIYEAPSSIDCSACATGSGCDPAELNTPSLSIPFMAGAATVTRTLTSVLGEAATFTTGISESSGFTITTSPASFFLQPGASQAVSISVQLKAGAPLNTWLTDGAITWSSGGGRPGTRIPVVVKGTLLGGPGELVILNRTTPKISYNVSPGFDGRIVFQGSGMYAAKVHTATVTQDPTTTFNFAEPWKTPGVAIFKIPPLSSGGRRMLARFLLDGSEYPGADLDLFIYKDGVVRGYSAGPSAAEQADFLGSQGQGLTVYVHGFNVPGGTATVKLYAWTLPIPSLANSALSVSPYVADAERGKPVTVSLKLGSRYVTTHSSDRFLGIVGYYRDTNANFMNLLTVISYAS